MDMDENMEERRYNKEINACYLLSFGSFFLGFYLVLKGYLVGFLGSILSPILGLYLALKPDKHAKFYGVLLVLFFAVWIANYMLYFKA